MVEFSSLTEKIWPLIEKILSTEADETSLIDILVLKSAQSTD